MRAIWKGSISFGLVNIDFFSYPQIFGTLDAPQIKGNQVLKICAICGFCLCARD